VGRWQQVLVDALDETLRLVSGRRSLIISAEFPPELSSTPREGSPQPRPPGNARVLLVPGADAYDNVGDRTYLVLAKPNVIMNDIRLRGLALAGSQATGRKSPHNHAQTARNLRRSLRNAAVSARLIQPEGQRVWTANRLPTSRHPLQMPSQSGPAVQHLEARTTTTAGDTPRSASRRQLSTLQPRTHP
jgi:hypothetical protein